MMLGLMLARRGVPVTVLEAHHDFDRDFRGDTLHPAILEIIDQLDLSDKLHAIPHVKWTGPSLVVNGQVVARIDFGRLKTPFPYVMIVAQERFLELLAAEAAESPHFRLVMGAKVQELIEHDGTITGVRYRESGTDQWHEVHATLTVGADGRFSRVRHLAGIEPQILSKPMELLWFRLARRDGDAAKFDSVDALLRRKPLAVLNAADGSAAGFIRRGNRILMIAFNRIDHWQVAYIYPPGSYHELKAAGLDAFRQSVAALEPEFAPHLATLVDWSALSPLSVAFSRCRSWHRPGLLLIGDAAHVMTPAAGAGIKYAIEDAVEAANLLAAPLLTGTLNQQHLASVQRRREWPTRVMQRLASIQQRNLFTSLADRDAAQRPPGVPLILRFLLRIPWLRDLPARFIAFGVRRVRVRG